MVDADVAPAGGGEGLAVPAAPAVAQAQAGQAGHQVELRRAGQPQAERTQFDAVGAEVDMGLVEDLGHRVVAAGFEYDPPGGDVPDLDELAAGTGRGGGHPALEHENAVAGPGGGGGGGTGDPA